MKNLAYILYISLWTISSIFLSQFVILYLFIFIFGSDFGKNPSLEFFYTLFVAVTEVFLVIFLPKKLKIHSKPMFKTTSETLGITGLPTFTDLGLAPAAFVVYYFLSLLLTSIISLFPWFDSSEVQSTGFDTFISTPEKILAFLALVIVTPVIEELIFRGFFYGHLREFLSKKLDQKTAVIISIFIVSFIFAILHGQWNVGVTVFALSIIMCLTRELTGTIYASIFLHMIKNAIAFFLLFVFSM